MRRLAERYLDEGRISSAYAILTEFLGDSLDSVDYVLEPYVETLVRRGEFERAEAVLAPYLHRRRGKRLLAELHHHAEQEQARVSVLRDLYDQSLEAICERAASLKPGHNVGVDEPGDMDVLCEVLSVASPEHYCESLKQANPAPWPRLDIVGRVCSYAFER